MVFDATIKSYRYLYYPMLFDATIKVTVDVLPSLRFAELKGGAPGYDPISSRAKGKGESIKITLIVLL